MKDFESELKLALEQTSAQLKLAGNLVESIQYSLLSEGKRIRPRMMCAAGETLGLSQESVLPAAIALEMIHCFTLIHDDLPCMDNDDFRRGRPSNHKVYGEGLALLAGDALIAVAFESFMLSCDRAKTPNNALKALKRFNHAIAAVMSGQAAEMTLTEGSSLKEMSLMHAQKTGALFSAAILIPMDLAGVEQDSPQGMALALFAAELGLAFQIADDLEDSTIEKVSPTSILHYMSAQEAQKTTLTSMESATTHLKKQWGSKAGALIQFSDEISKKIKNAI